MTEGKDKTPELYCSPAIKPPTLEDLSALNDSLRLGCTVDDLKTYQGHIGALFGATYEVVSKLPDPQLPVTYPRTPGYKPTAAENELNAWYWKCDIKGAATGKLAGKRVAVKDSIPVAGVPMMNGSKILEGYVPEYDATVVTRVLDAGGTIAGKTNTEDLCLSGSSFTCSNGPVLNPNDKSRSSGGSTSGNAALLAANEIDFAVGADQGGSIRIPSSWCGIVGMKPTYGLVPYTGCGGMEYTLDYAGPMARTVKDCALLLEVMAGLDGKRDPRQPRDLQVPEYSKLLSDNLSGKRIGVVTEGFQGVEPDVAKRVREATNSLRQIGATVEDVSVPMHLTGVKIFLPIFLEGVYQTYFKGGGSGYFMKGHHGISLQEAMHRGIAHRPYDLSITGKLICLLGEYVQNKYQNKFYAKCQNLVQVLTEAYDAVLQDYDVLILPTMPFKATKIPAQDDTLSTKLKLALGMLQNTCQFNATGHPAITVNTGKSEGLPVGMSVVGRPFEDSTVLHIAHAYEILRDKQ